MHAEIVIEIKFEDVPLRVGIDAGGFPPGRHHLAAISGRATVCEVNSDPLEWELVEVKVISGETAEVDFRPWTFKRPIDRYHVEAKALFLWIERSLRDWLDEEIKRKLIDAQRGRDAADRAFAMGA
jgi:hypothetical protein